MKQAIDREKPWWSDYSAKRLLGFFMLLVVVSAIPGGILRAYLVTLFGWPDSVVFGLMWGITMALPLIVVRRMRKSGRDGWLLRKELGERDTRKTSNQAMQRTVPRSDA